MSYDKLMELYNKLILLTKQLKEYQALCEKEALLYEELDKSHKSQSKKLN